MGTIAVAPNKRRYHKPPTRNKIRYSLISIRHALDSNIWLATEINSFERRRYLREKAPSSASLDYIFQPRILALTSHREMPPSRSAEYNLIYPQHAAPLSTPPAEGTTRRRDKPKIPRSWSPMATSLAETGPLGFHTQAPHLTWRRR